MNAHKSADSKPLIVVVDDDSSSRESTQLLLRSAGYFSEVFASAQDFLESSRLQETCCLILDVRMPGMDGLELQRRLNEAERRIPIIFITAHATENEERRALREGAVDFLRKPVNDEKLLRAIQTALEGGQNHERTRR